MGRYKVKVRAEMWVEVEADDGDEAKDAAPFKAAHEVFDGDWVATEVKHVPG